jgi:hypothetical protein
MGVDFIRKATPTFKKSWDRGRVVLATPDLFTCSPNCAARRAAFNIVGGADFQLGDQVMVEAAGAALVALRGLTEVARDSSPATELLRAVEASCGVAVGTVEQIHSISGVVEISLC